MIYWILHKPLTKTDLTNPIEGCPGEFYKLFDNLVFLDISNFSLFAKIENTLLKIKKTDLISLNINPKRYFFINNKRDFLNLKNKNDNDIFVFQSFNNIRIREFYNLLSKNEKITLFLNHWQLPIAEKFPQKKKTALLKKILKIDKKIIFLRFLYRLYYLKKQKPIFTFNYALSSGNQMIEDLKKENVHVKQIIPVHSVSYDEFLLANTKVNASAKEPYFVFVDQALTIHPDNKGISNATAEYHEEIINALKFISKQNNNIKIIIAEHPRCHYQKGFWGKFECYQGKTSELIKNSQAVIGHFSTALNISFFYKKKLFLLKTSSNYFPFNKNVDNAFKLLGGTVFDMNTLKVCSEKESCDVNLTDYFTLQPNNPNTNKTLFYDFLSEYNT